MLCGFGNTILLDMAIQTNILDREIIHNMS